MDMLNFVYIFIIYVFGYKLCVLFSISDVSGFFDPMMPLKIQLLKNREDINCIQVQLLVPCNLNHSHNLKQRS
jgi:hypothetical protein